MLTVISKALGQQVITPTPLISISHTPLKNKIASLGCTYNIVLNGTIVVPPQNNVGNKLKSILQEQNRIRQIFAYDGQQTTITYGSTTGIKFFPNIVSIDFQEGQYLDTCSYSVNLEAPFLFKGDNILSEGLVSNFSPAKYDTDRQNFLFNAAPANYSSLISTWGGVVDDFSDVWSIEIDNSFSQTINDYTSYTPPEASVGYTSQDIKAPFIYRLTRSMSATGRTVYIAGTKYSALDHAVGFINKTLLQIGSSLSYRSTNPNEKYRLYPGYRKTDDAQGSNSFSSEILNIPSNYKGYNHVRSINYDSNAGSYSVTDTWILAPSDSAIENYTISVDSSRENPRKTVKINGTIKGLSDIVASGYQPDFTGDDVPYNRALNKYYSLTDNGKFGLNCGLFKRARYMASGVYLNSQPLSISLASNESAGEITYSVDFDDRPLNYFSGVLAENITVNDTYPGDIYALIPVIGRSSGPVIQYVRSRTVYSRDVNIEILLDHTDVSYANNPTYAAGQNSYSARDKILLNKPSLNTPIRDQLRDLILMLSPSGDPDVTKLFLNPANETWSPKEGRYTLSLNWNYEKSK